MNRLLANGVMTMKAHHKCDILTNEMELLYVYRIFMQSELKKVVMILVDEEGVYWYGRPGNISDQIFTSNSVDSVVKVPTNPQTLEEDEYFHNLMSARHGFPMPFNYSQFKEYIDTLYIKCDEPYTVVDFKDGIIKRIDYQGKEGKLCKIS
jgi:hypothetical protein